MRGRPRGGSLGSRPPPLTAAPRPSGLSPEKAAAFSRRLRSEPRFLLAQNVATCSDPLEVCLQRQVVQDTVQVFQHALPAEGKPVTNQKNSGKRCWGGTGLEVGGVPGGVEQGRGFRGCSWCAPL